MEKIICFLLGSDIDPKSKFHWGHREGFYWPCIWLPWYPFWWEGRVDGKFLLKYREATATEDMRGFIWEPLHIPSWKHGFQLALKGKINILVDCTSLCMRKLTAGQMYNSKNTCWFIWTNFYVSLMCQVPFKLILIKISNLSGLYTAHL